jgi:hypothetical protein
MKIAFLDALSEDQEQAKSDRAHEKAEKDLNNVGD